MSGENFNPTEIVGFDTDRVAVGAVLTIGTKSPQHGAPIDKDRFYIKVPKGAAPDGKSNEERPAHPAFAKFNAAAPEHRRVISGRLCHRTLPECFQFKRHAQKLPNMPSPPNKRPACVGDGCNAVRFVSGQFREIPCPGEKCEYAMGDKPACKPWARLYFMPVWGEASKLPRPIMKFETRGWHTLKNMVAFFNACKREFRERLMLSDDQFVFFDIPFTLMLSEQSSAEKKARFPVVTMSMDGDIVDVLRHRLDRVKQIATDMRATDLAMRQLPEVVDEHPDPATFVQAELIESETVKPEPKTPRAYQE